MIRFGKIVIEAMIVGKDPTSEVRKWPCEVNFLLHEDTCNRISQGVELNKILKGNDVVPLFICPNFMQRA